MHVFTLKTIKTLKGLEHGVLRSERISGWKSILEKRRKLLPLQHKVNKQQRNRAEASFYRTSFTLIIIILIGNHRHVHRKEVKMSFFTTRGYAGTESLYGIYRFSFKDLSKERGGSIPQIWRSTSQ